MKASFKWFWNKKDSPQKEVHTPTFEEKRNMRMDRIEDQKRMRNNMNLFL